MVNRSAREISDLWDFAEKVKEKLFEAAEGKRVAAVLLILESLLHIHQILFVHVAAQNSAGAKGKAKSKGRKKEALVNDAQFIVTLLETVEDELARQGVEVIKPELGEPFDVHTMDCTTTVKKNSRKDKPNTVATVNRCGFLYRMPNGSKRTYNKAQVEVFAK